METNRAATLYALPVAAVGVLLGLRRAELPLGDSDVLWGARTGLDILSTGDLPHHATYSWTAAGRSWVPNSWGWDVVLGSAYKIGGLAAISVLGLLVIALLAMVLTHASARIGASPGWTAVVFAAVGLFVLQDLRPRPQLVAYVMIFALPPLLPRVLFGSRRHALRAGAMLCGLEVLWMNLHTSAVVGPIMLAAGGAGLLLRAAPPDLARRQIAGRLVAVVAATALCCLVTPYGTAPITNIEEVRRASIGLIDEWDPSGIHGTGPILGLVAIGLAVLAGWLAYRARRFDAIGYLAVFAVATASAVRFTPMLFLLAIPELAVAANKLPVRTWFLNRIVAAGCLVLAVFAVSGLGQFAKLDDSVASPRLAAEVPPNCRMVNDYTMGGALMLSRPDLRVSVDGRNDMYGRPLLLSVEGMLSNAKGTLQRLDSSGVDCVLTESTDKLVAALKASPKWRVTGTDSQRTLLVRVSP